MGILDNFWICEQKQKYLRNKSYFYDVILWVELYMYWIVGQVKKCNMLMELVLLFIVESVFDLYVMFGVNVVGIWQIILSIGCNYGLKQICSYDVCCDVVVFIIVVLDMM